MLGTADVEAGVRARTVEGSTFAQVWDVIAREPYRVLPQRRLRWRDLSAAFVRGLVRDGERTLRDEADLRPEFDKLVHPVGIALRGVWHVTERTEYSGYFRQDSMALLIARASDAVGEARPGKLRFMGMAGKLWPTLDEQRPARTANFFLLENLGGTHTPHYAHAAFENDLLPFRPHPGMATKGPIGAAAAAAFTRADRTLDFTQAAVRQLYPIAELANHGPARAPRFMRLVGDATNPRIDAADLREELARAIQPQGLRFRIEIADESSRFVPRRWQAIGSVLFTAAVASHGVDHRLHFTHPKYRRDAPRAR